ncbi:MAG: sodium/calcium exchanger protein [Myxococcota bacterium]
MAGGGDEGSWIRQLVIGGVLLGAAFAARIAGAPEWLHALLLAAGGLATVFGSCEAMILCVEGIGKRLGWNPFVAGTMAGLASNVPEVVMLGFVLAAAPRVGFIVVMMTLHVGAMAFGIYSVLLPRDDTGQARLPKALVEISTDLYATAAGVFFSTGLIMVLMKSLGAGDHGGEGLGAIDLYVIGALLLLVEVVAVRQLVSRFSSDEDGDGDTDAADAAIEAKSQAAKDGAPSTSKIAMFGVIGMVASVIGGHAVGDFADVLVEYLEGEGYSEMVGALILSVFAAAGALAMIVTAHRKGMVDVALAGASGQINQVPFVVLPIALIQIAAFAQLGIIPVLDQGVVLPTDLETASVVLMSFPTMLILWKAVQDDGKVNWVETASMVSVFGLILYFLARHG